MPIKRNNHVVTRGYLEGWSSTDDEQRIGIWYFDIPARAVRFSPGLKASFAINRDLYAPVYADGQRDDRFENWLAENEGALCDLARAQAASGKRGPKSRVVYRALESIVSSGYRSAYAVRELELIFKAQDSDLTDEEARLAVLNSIYAVTHDRMRFFKSGRVVILRNMPIRLFTNDQPFWDLTPQAEHKPMAFFALAPRCLMLFAPDRDGREGRFSVEVRDGSDKAELAELVRLCAMRMARDWVVCPNKSEAEAVAAYLTEDIIAEVRSTDRARLFEVTELRSLFQI